jgi:enoyl-[acyl-carrier protein] reductase I
VEVLFMKSLLANKNILIMGLRNKWSIAWGIAREYHKQGANIILSYQGKREEDGVLKLSKSLGHAKCYECDVASDSGIKKLFSDISEEYKSLDGIVHCIAHAIKEDIDGDFINTSRGGFMHALDISAYSLINITRNAVSLLNPGSAIITLSYLGAERVLPGYNVMGIAKAALEATVRYLAYDLGKKNIRINGISAGPVKTISSKAINNIQTILDAVEERAPLKRNVNIDDIGKTALYLISDLASGVTGETIHVDSGYSIMGI